MKGFSSFTLPSQLQHRRAETAARVGRWAVVATGGCVGAVSHWGQGQCGAGGLLLGAPTLCLDAGRHRGEQQAWWPSEKAAASALA